MVKIAIAAKAVGEQEKFYNLVQCVEQLLDGVTIYRAMAKTLANGDNDKIEATLQLHMNDQLPELMTPRLREAVKRIEEEKT